MMISIKMRKLLAPSMRADSSRSLGIASRYPFISGIHQDHPSDVDQHQRQMAVNQAKQLRQDKDRNQRRKLLGIICSSRNSISPFCRPLKRKRGEGVSGKANANQGQYHGQEADFHRVPVPGEVIHIAIEQIGIVLERHIFRND